MTEREPMKSSLEKELLALEVADQRAMKTSDVAAARVNTERAKQFLERHGWVSTSEVSENAQNALWLTVLHSDHDVTFQQRSLEELQRAVDTERAPKWQLAWLTDRVRRNTLQPQVFGVYYPYTRIPATGEVVSTTVEDEEHMEERWRGYDLAPHLGAQSFVDHRQKIQEKYQAYLNSLPNENENAS